MGGTETRSSNFWQEAIRLRVIRNTSYIGQEFYKDVMIRQLNFKHEPIERYKLFDMKSKFDKFTIGKLTVTGNKAFRKSDHSVDILKVNIDSIPHKLKLDTIQSAKVGLEVVESRIISQNAPNSNELLKELREEMRLVLDIYHRKEKNEFVSPSEEIYFQNHWILIGAKEVHKSWTDDQTVRSGLDVEFDQLDAFEQEKDVIFIAAALQVLMR